MILTCVAVPRNGRPSVRLIRADVSARTGLSSEAVEGREEFGQRERFGKHDVVLAEQRAQTLLDLRRPVRAHDLGAYHAAKCPVRSSSVSASLPLDRAPGCRVRWPRGRGGARPLLLRRRHGRERARSRRPPVPRRAGRGRQGRHLVRQHVWPMHLSFPQWREFVGHGQRSSSVVRPVEHTIVRAMTRSQVTAPRTRHRPTALCIDAQRAAPARSPARSPARVAPGSAD